MTARIRMRTMKKAFFAVLVASAIALPAFVSAQPAAKPVPAKPAPAKVAPAKPAPKPAPKGADAGAPASTTRKSTARYMK